VGGVAVIIAMVAPLQQAHAASPAARARVSRYDGLSRAQQATLLSIARDTWKFYNLDVTRRRTCPWTTSLRGRLGRPTSYGQYTSAANIGVYLWAVVSAGTSA